MPDQYQHEIASDLLLDQMEADYLVLEQVRATYAIAERLEALVGKLEDLERTHEVIGGGLGSVLQDLTAIVHQK